MSRTRNVENQSDGTDAFLSFDALVRKVLSVPHEEIMRREALYKEQSKANPNRRGPKRKVKPSALSGHVAMF
jgi:hypothetical protein